MVDKNEAASNSSNLESRAQFRRGTIRFERVTCEGKGRGVRIDLSFYRVILGFSEFTG